MSLPGEFIPFVDSEMTGQVLSSGKSKVYNLEREKLIGMIEIEVAATGEATPTTHDNMIGLFDNITIKGNGLDIVNLDGAKIRQWYTGRTGVKADMLMAISAIDVHMSFPIMFVRTGADLEVDDLEKLSKNQHGDLVVLDARKFENLTIQFDVNTTNLGGVTDPTIRVHTYQWMGEAPMAINTAWLQYLEFADIATTTGVHQYKFTRSDGDAFDLEGFLLEVDVIEESGERNLKFVMNSKDKILDMDLWHFFRKSLRSLKSFAAQMEMFTSDFPTSTKNSDEYLNDLNGMGTYMHCFAWRIVRKNQLPQEVTDSQTKVISAAGSGATEKSANLGAPGVGVVPNTGGFV